MLDKAPIEIWQDKNADMFESSFGNGNFIIEIIRRKIQNGSTWQEALQHTYGIELIQENVNETYDRIFQLFNQLHIEYNKVIALDIMKQNLVCSNFFDWDIENWCPKKKDMALF